MNTKIDREKTEGCDKISRVYCENFNALQPLLVADGNVAVLGNIQIRLDSMDVFDRAALGLYIGKFVEQEINSSIVQLMRYAIGIDMPDYFCKRDPRFWQDEVEVGNRTIRINRQADPTDRISLATIPAGDAYYALDELKKESDVFEDYKWLYEKEFLDSWRKLFRFRNSVAHIGHLITQSELEEAYSWFEIFLKYMPNIKALKVDLAPEGMFDNELNCDNHEINQTNLQDNVSLPKASIEQFDRVTVLLQKNDQLTEADMDELNSLYNEYDWMTIVFSDGKGKKGMRHVDGRVLIPAIYEEIGLTFNCIYYNMNTIPAMKDGKCGLVKCDGTGCPSTDFIYDSIESIPWIKYAFKYKRGGSLSSGILLADGRELVPCIIDKYYEPSNSCLIFKSGDYYGLWDLDEKVVMPMFDDIEVSEPNDPLVFTLNGIKGYLDKDLRFVPKSDVDTIEDEDERYDAILEFLSAEYDI